MAKKSYDFGQVKKQAQTDQEKQNGSGLRGKQLKLTSGVNRVLVLPPYKKGTMYKKVMVHQIWKGGKPVMTATCARIEDGNDCDVCSSGWKLKDKYESSESEKKQNLWKNFMPTNDTYVNVINLQGDDKNVKFLKLPADAVELLLNEIDDSEDGRDICDLDEGRPLKIKGNGKDGTHRRYKVVKFEKKGAELSDEVDEDEVMNSLHNLDGLQPKFSEKKLSDLLKKLKKGLLGSVEADEDDDEDTVEDDDDQEVDADSDDDDSDFDDDDDDSDSDEDVDDEDDDDSDLDDSDDDDDSDFDDDDDDDDEPEPSKKKNKNKKVAKKKSSTKSKPKPKPKGKSKPKSKSKGKKNSKKKKLRKG